MRKPALALLIIVLLGPATVLLLPSVGFSVDTADEHEERDGDTKKQVEVSVSPKNIKRISISYDLTFFILRSRGKELKREYEAYMERLPFEGRFSKDEMAELRKDPGKFHAEKDAQLKELLKEQYYLWKAVRDMAKTLEGVRDSLEQYHQHLVLEIEVETAPTGVQSLTFRPRTYRDARAIAKDLRSGSITSLTVTTAFRNYVGEWRVCTRCLIDAFGY